MSALLEGVLSEDILDKLASDLGIEADVLRRNPFFRVYKGRVLLTYPLKGNFEEYAYDGALANNTSFLPAAGTLVYNASIDGTPPIALLKFYFGLPEMAEDAYARDPLMSMPGPMYCDGEGYFRNVTGEARNITLRGRSFL